MSDKSKTLPLENDNYELKQMFNGYVFYIPDYQRFYSWEQSHCEDLWNDLRNIIEEERNHYMGTVICQEEDSIETIEFENNYREYSIVDGQQRFTTLIILTKALLKAYKDIKPKQLESKNKKIYDRIPNEEAEKLFVKDSKIEDNKIRYDVDNKLSLQKDDNKIFKDILRGYTELANPNTPSQQRLLKAYTFFKKRIDKFKSKYDTENYLRMLGQMISKVQSLQFMLYTIQTQGEATLIFQSINDRGKGLSDLDKTKSFLMHKVYLNEEKKKKTDESNSRRTEKKESSKIEIKDVQRKFGDVFKSMQDIEDAERTSKIEESQIQQYHFISKIQQKITKEYLEEKTDRQRSLKNGAPLYLDVIKWHFNQLHDCRNQGAHKGYKRDCLDEIDWYTDGLSRYFSHMSEIGRYNDDEIIQWELTKLFGLGKLGNFYPLLLTVWDEYKKSNLTSSEIKHILETIEIGSFRIYSVANKRSDTGESRFYRLANNVAKDGPDVDYIIKEIENAIDRYETDFAESLKNPNIYSIFKRRDLRYLLYSYDLYIRNESDGGAAPKMEQAVQNAGRDYSIDHIWASNPNKLNLSEDEEEVHEEIKHSLGNLTLTTGPRNSSWKNLPYEKKRERKKDKKDYMSSDFASTRKIARNYHTWGESEIKSRLDDVVDYAEKRWSLDPKEREKYIKIRPS